MNKRYILIPQQPILISGPTTGNYRTTLDHIPGSAMRGALVSTFLKEFGKQEGYNEYLRSGAPIFSHAYPTDDRFFEPRPLPVTAVTAKYNPGFRRETAQPGVMDMMLVQWQQLMTAIDVIDEELVSHQGYYYLDERNNQRIYTYADNSLRTQITTHVGLNRRRHVAEDGLLYSREGLVFQNNYGFFIGRTDMSDETADKIHGMTLHIGGNRSRGMGRCRIEIEDAPTTTTDQLLNRCQEFSQFVKQSLKNTGINTEADYITLDTVTPFVPDRLQSYNSAPLISGATLEQAWTQVNEQSGWHSAAGLPRTSYETYHATYLYSTSNLPDIVDRLLEIQINGAGQQRDRGYGRFSVCEYFHMDGFDAQRSQLKGVNT